MRIARVIAIWAIAQAIVGIHTAALATGSCRERVDGCVIGKVTDVHEQQEDGVCWRYVDVRVLWDSSANLERQVRFRTQGVQCGGSLEIPHGMDSPPIFSVAKDEIVLVAYVHDPATGTIAIVDKGTVWDRDYPRDLEGVAQLRELSEGPDGSEGDLLGLDVYHGFSMRVLQSPAPSVAPDESAGDIEALWFLSQTYSAPERISDYLAGIPKRR